MVRILRIYVYFSIQCLCSRHQKFLTSVEATVVVNRYEAGSEKVTGMICKGEQVTIFLKVVFNEQDFNCVIYVSGKSH